MHDEHKRADVRVGIFVLCALIILVVGSLWIAGSTLLAPQRIDDGHEADDHR